jgi:PAS domain S-box-containing protein
VDGAATHRYVTGMFAGPMYAPVCGPATRLQLLSKVGTLAGMLEYDEVLAAVARLSIPELADWSIVDVVQDGEVRRAEVAHRDPSKAALAEEIRRIPPSSRHRAPSWQALLSGRSLIVAEYTDEMMREQVASGALTLGREMGARSLLVVPLVVRGAVVAVATFVMTSESGRRYGPEDLALAEELAQRAAQLVENARLHQELKKSEERFRVALAHTHVSVFEKDRDLRFRWIYNPGFGLEPSDVIGKTDADFVRPEDAAHLDALQRAVLETGEPSRREECVVIGGETRHLVSHVEPLRDGSGEIVGLTGAFADITEQKQAQEALAEALAFRERVMGILGHDLRNPLSAVRVLSSLLLRRADLPDRARDQVAEIDRAGKRMLEMIGTLLDFSESRFKGSLPIAPVPMDLHEVARGVVEECLAANPDREVELAIRGDGRGRWDPARMAQVVSNLVGNALKHGARDEPVRVSLHCDGDGEVCLAVENRGKPIPPALLPVLFEPFRRGSNGGDASHARGLGLGLYIAKQIVTAHGGEIDVSSTAEDGTRFAVRLPRGMALAAAPHPDPLPAARGEEGDDRVSESLST